MRISVREINSLFQLLGERARCESTLSLLSAAINESPPSITKMTKDVMVRTVLRIRIVRSAWMVMEAVLGMLTVVTGEERRWECVEVSSASSDI